jgi:hypothetical protein
MILLLSSIISLGVGLFFGYRRGRADDDAGRHLAKVYGQLFDELRETLTIDGADPMSIARPLALLANEEPDQLIRRAWATLTPQVEAIDVDEEIVALEELRAGAWISDIQHGARVASTDSSQYMSSLVDDSHVETDNNSLLISTGVDLR